MLDYDVKILADSLSPGGVRLTTWEITFPRFILAEFNTHRKLSRNSASSRAIPTEKQIKRVLERPFVPQFNKRVTGMGVGDPLSELEQEAAEKVWLQARDDAVYAAQNLLHVDKSRANRLLEPFTWHTVIATATAWGNFFALRTDAGAQPEFRKIAEWMQGEYEQNVPRLLRVGEWHLPLVFAEDFKKVDADELPAVSSGRCARVSFDRHHDTEPVEKSIERHNLLTSNGHWSPTEHQAFVMPSAHEAAAFNGNFHGEWGQFRKTFLYEDDFSWLKLSEIV